MVFTCVTDTGRLVWDIKNTAVSFHSSAYLNISIELDIVFNVTLLSITGNTYHSTATAAHVPVSFTMVQQLHAEDKILQTSNKESL